jgi:phage RecT family recombinase
MTTPSTALTKPANVATLIESATDRLTPLLPDGLSLEKLAQVVYFEARKNPDLLKCTPASIVAAVARALRTGLEIGETVYLLPFGNTCTVVADYKGLAQLMVASRAVRAVEGECVYEGDEFTMRLGLDARLDHVPCGQRAKRGKMVGAYVILRLPGGLATWKYMAVEDIEAIRQKHSRSWKRGPIEDIPWYATKTVLRQIAKLMPKDPRLSRFFTAIEDEDRMDAAPAVLERPDTVDADGVEIEPAPAATEEDDLAIDREIVEAEAADELPLGDAPRRRNAMREGR